MIKVALAGQPNSGKTTLFNILTGARAHVGNWPGVTVEKREGLYRKDRTNEAISIVDLPGIYSLSPYTTEEIISRDYLLGKNCDIIINIIDSTTLERSLYLTTQLLETNIPLVIALNMSDELQKSGKQIDVKLLEKRLGVPVISISALREEGINELIEAVRKNAKKKRKARTVLENSEISETINLLEENFRSNEVVEPLFHAIKLLENDEYEIKKHPEALKFLKNSEFKFTSTTFNDDVEAFIADARYRWIVTNLEGVVSNVTKEETTPSKKKRKLSRTGLADKILTHRIFGIPIFIAIVFIIFHLTFSENFLFIGGLLGEDFVTLPGTAFEGVFGEGGINSPGVILFNLLELACNSISDGLASIYKGPEWLGGLLFDGILAGVFAVLSFLPQIIVLYFFISLLEDTGYMARVAFNLDRIFRKFGLSGRSIIPMLMGFGCSIPAMINARTLKSEHERVATIRVIPFFSCGAKVPILLVVSGGIVQYFGVGNVDVIVFSMYAIGVVLAMITAIIMRKTMLKGETTPFIMELPPYRVPKAKALFIHLYDKAKHFVKKAFTIILVSSVVVWFLAHFSFNWEFLEDSQIEQSILMNVAQLVRPLFTPLGFGSQLTKYGWVFIAASVTGLIAKENAIGTFGTIAASLAAAGLITIGGDSDVDSVTAMIQLTNINLPALLSFIVFNMTTIPCMAAVATAKAELTRKQFIGTIIFWLAVSYVISSFIYLIGSWWWTLFIILAILGLAVVGYFLYQKYQNNKVARV